MDTMEQHDWRRRVRAAYKEWSNRPPKKGSKKKMLQRQVYNLTKQVKELKKAKPYAVKLPRPKDPFYDSRAWLELRYEVLRDHKLKYGDRCNACRRFGVELHMDHIKPRSKYPELALVRDNLQVLCKPCNIGKSNKDETDFRPSNYCIKCKHSHGEQGPCLSNY